MVSKNACVDWMNVEKYPNICSDLFSYDFGTLTLDDLCSHSFLDDAWRCPFVFSESNKCTKVLKEVQLFLEKHFAVLEFG